MEKPSTLHLFTLSYPYGNGEPFIENELMFLATKFEYINVYPLSGSGTKRLTPSNVTVVNLNHDQTGNSTFKTMVSNFGLLFCVYALELLKSKKSIVFIKHWREFNSRFCKSIKLSLVIEKMITNGSDIFYSFWMNDAAEALSALKFRNKIKHFVFRTNGFDLYENQTKYNYIAFRPFIFKQADKMFAVSKKGAEHMRALGVGASKIQHSYFGTNDYGLSVFNPSQKLTLFTCSDLRRIKRADRMVDILKHITVPVKWIHHGNKGDSEKKFFEKIKELPLNVEFDLHERKNDYSEVLEFFRKNHFNLFLLLSESEGIPVSIIEAMSFGIPVLATDVGGVSEVINTENGILIEKDFKDKEVADRILEFASSHRNSAAFRQKVRGDWEQRFKAEKNYEKFYQEIVSI